MINSKGSTTKIKLYKVIRFINVPLINNFNFVVLKEQGATTKEGEKTGHQEALTYLENRRKYAVI